jgi:hypothetical protein
MLAGLLRSLRYAQEERAAIRAWSPLAQVLLWGTLGMYTGWSSVAVWLNLTTALVGSGLPITTAAATVGQGAILAGAVGTAVAITWFTRGLRGHHRLGAGWGDRRHRSGGIPRVSHDSRTRLGYRARHRRTRPASSQAIAGPSDQQPISA